MRPKEGLPRPFSGRRSRRSVRSGYAFAHSEGFGRLITSGRIMREAGQGAVTLRGKNGAPARYQEVQYLLSSLSEPLRLGDYFKEKRDYANFPQYCIQWQWNQPTCHYVLSF